MCVICEINSAVFFQSDWDLIERFNLLSGARFDKHSLLSGVVFSPRFSLLYKFKKNAQFRLSYSTGFRAPQAFDSDLHIAFAGFVKEVKFTTLNSDSANPLSVGYVPAGQLTHTDELTGVSAL